jgi:DNA polymerase-4
MPCSQAYRLCPEAIFVPPRFEVYTAVSRQIRELFREYTDLVEPMSLDEAYLDVTANKKGNPSATLIALEIKKEIFRRTGLTASAGVSYCKFIAKIASDFKKPDGFTVVPPDKAAAFLENLPIGKFFGVGKVTERHMRELGIRTGGDLKARSLEDLQAAFGNQGRYYYDIARGIDDRPVNPNWIRKSIGRERTFERDLKDLTAMDAILREPALEVVIMLEKTKLFAKTLTLKVRYANFQRITRSHSWDYPFRDAGMFYERAAKLLRKTEAGKRLVRLLGISMSNLSSENGEAQADEYGFEE